MEEMVNASLTRRRFVGLTAAAAGASLLTTQPILRAATGANDKLQIALIGLGAQGRILMDSLLQIEGVQLVAVCDVWDYARTYAERLLKRSNVIVKGYADYKDLLATEKDLDAVVIATPDFWHAPMTNDCLRAGLHVYCEKMMSNTVDGARSMVQAMRETGKLLQIGHQRRSNPRYQFALLRLLREAKICGRLTAAQGQWNRAASPDLGWPKNSDIPAETLKKYGYRDMQQFRNWRWYRDLGGGPLSDLGAHQIDIFNWWFGVPPRAVLASGGVDYYKNREWYDNAMVIYEYPLADGVARAFYQVQTTTSAGAGYFEYFMGDQGSIRISENPRLGVIYREASAPPWDELVAKSYIRPQETAAYGPPAAASQKVDARETPPVAAYEIPVTFTKAIHQPHLENFFESVRGKAKLNCPADEAFASEYTIFKANEAISAQRTLEMKPEEFRA